MRERAEATLELAIELGNPFRRAMGEISLGWVDVTTGDLEAGIARMRRHGLELKAAGSEAMMDYWLAAIATALGRMGRLDQGFRTIEEGFLVIERTGARCNEAEIHRMKGELLLAQDASNAAQAERSFRTGIDIARKQKAKSWELRATTSLARLLDRQGRRDEARVMLADIYGWFTEGFDTADLKDAKSLLEDLGG
jgi:predicted ATPase